MKEIEVIDYNIRQVELILENVFDRFSNGNFKCFIPVYYIYNENIKFVPIELKSQVDALYALIEMMQMSKNKILSKKLG